MIKENMISVNKLKINWNSSPLKTYLSPKLTLIFLSTVVFGATGFTGALTAEYLAEIKDEVKLMYQSTH